MVSSASSFHERLQIHYSSPHPEDVFTLNTGVLVFTDQPDHALEIPVQVSVSDSSNPEQVENGTSAITLSCTQFPRKMRIQFFPDFETRHRDLISRVRRVAFLRKDSIEQYRWEHIIEVILSDCDPMGSLQQFASIASWGTAKYLFESSMSLFLSRLSPPTPMTVCIRKIKSPGTQIFFSSTFKMSCALAYQRFCVQIDEKRSGFYWKNKAEDSGGGNKNICVLHPVAGATVSTCSYVLAKSRRKTPQGRFSPKKIEALEDSLKRECKILSYLKKAHVPNILDMIEVPYVTGKEVRRAAFMEHCDQGTLSDFVLGEPDFRVRMRLGEQLVKAVVEMHKRRVYHLDLSDDNILVTTENGCPSIRIADFGNSVLLPEGEGMQIDISAAYPAPEMYLDHINGRYSSVTEALDLWGLGDLLHLLRFGYSMCEHYLLGHSSKKYCKNLHGFASRQRILFDSYDLLLHTIGELLSIDPKLRPPAIQVLERLRYWMSTHLSTENDIEAMFRALGVYIQKL